jgi:hypothetical protein
VNPNTDCLQTAKLTTGSKTIPYHEACLGLTCAFYLIHSIAHSEDIDSENRIAAFDKVKPTINKLALNQVISKVQSVALYEIKNLLSTGHSWPTQEHMSETTRLIALKQRTSVSSKLFSLRTVSCIPDQPVSTSLSRLYTRSTETAT